jgi:hypothetical protein
MTHVKTLEIPGSMVAPALYLITKDKCTSGETDVGFQNLQTNFNQQ